MIYESIRQYYSFEKQNILKKCDGCSKCISVCPNVASFNLNRKDIKALSHNLLACLDGGPISDQLYQWVFGCNCCGLCKDICPQGIDTVLFNKILRYEFLCRGDKRVKMFRKHMTQGDFSKIFKILNHLLMKDLPVRWLTDIPETPEPADTVVFLGCIGLVRPDIAYSLLDVMDIIGMPYVAVGGLDFCCGSRFQFIGDVDLFEVSLRNMLVCLMKFKPKRILYLCAECMHNAIHVGSHILDIPFKQEYPTKYLIEHAQKLPFENEKPISVSFHDSCSLGRSCGDYESPRRLLNRIPGVELVEMRHSRQNGYCCGAPSNAFFPGKNENLEKMRYQEFKETEASTLITTCAGCEMVYQAGDRYHDMHSSTIFPFIAEFLGIKRGNPLSPFYGRRDVDGMMERYKETVTDGIYTEDEYRMAISKVFGIKPQKN